KLKSLKFIAPTPEAQRIFSQSFHETVLNYAHLLSPGQAAGAEAEPCRGACRQVAAGRRLLTLSFAFSAATWAKAAPLFLPYALASSVFAAAIAGPGRSGGGLFGAHPPVHYRLDLGKMRAAAASAALSGRHRKAAKRGEELRLRRGYFAGYGLLSAWGGAVYQPYALRAGRRLRAQPVARGQRPQRICLRAGCAGPLRLRQRGPPRRYQPGAAQPVP
nr:hypothetical protein [Tanacetum cinerariifolium]